MTELENPTGNFKKRLDELHISLDQIDVRTNGLSGVFDNLRKAGFSASDAFESLQARAATSFVALLNNTEALKSNYSSLLNARGATEAQSQAMDTLRGAGEKLLHNLEALSITSSSGLLGGLKLTIQGLTAMVGAANGASGALSFVTVAMTALAAGQIGSFLARVVGNLTITTRASQALTVALAEVRAAQGFAATSTAILGAGMSALGGPVGALVAGLVAGIAILGNFSDGSGKAAEEQNKLKEAAANSRSALEENAKAVESLNDLIARASSISGPTYMRSPTASPARSSRSCSRWGSARARRRPMRSSPTPSPS